MLQKKESLNHQRLYDLAFSLATESPDREPVKFGIAILGLYPMKENLTLFLTLGRHEEFTLFCAEALVNQTDMAESSLFLLGQNVHGWGAPLHVVRTTCQTAWNPGITKAARLLREGFRISTPSEYAAVLCARA